MNPNRASVLRELLNGNQLVMAPGAFDPLSARIVEQTGFPAVYMTGAGVASSRLGVPDIGLATMTEVLETAKNIVQVTTIPLICDIDTGFGNAINLIRTVREFETIGAAALQIEDQVTPKRCGHLEGKQLVSTAEMVKKIEAFQYARRSDDLVLIARTDAIAVTGLDDAIARARAYAAAGADVLFVEAPKTVDQMKRINDELSDVPLLINIVEGGGKTPILAAGELEALGYRLAIYPVSAWTAAIAAMQKVLAELKQKGTTEGLAENMVSFKEMFEVVGLSHYHDLQNRFLS